MFTDDILLLASLLILAAVLITKVGNKLGAPSLLLFLLLGMLVGADGLGLVLDDYEMAEGIGHFSMSIILFAAGLETHWSQTKPILKQSILLSTVGVMITTILTGLFIFFVFGHHVGGAALTVVGCLMIAAVLSPTDSISVFAILRDKRLHLRENLGPMLEVESGSNDPMANILTVILVGVLTESADLSSWQMAGHAGLNFLLQIFVGLAVGLATGFAGKWLLEHIHLDNSSLYAILILSVCFVTNSLAGFLHGNELLAVYASATYLGNRAKLESRRDVMKFFEGISWLMQLVMFLMLGLLARPSTMGPLLLPALFIGLFLMVVARPASVFLTLMPFRGLSVRAKTLVSWVGLKGAGPILCALCPVVEGMDNAGEIFNIVFLISLLSLVLQGFSFPILTKTLDLSYDADPEVNTFGIDIPEEMGMLRDHIVTEEDLTGGSTLRDLRLPHGIRVMMVRRGERFLVPHGSMQLEVGDKLVIIMGESDD